VGPSTVSRFCVDLFDKYPSLNYSKEIKKKKVDKGAFIYRIPDGKKGVGDSGCKSCRYYKQTKALT
jgi:hypothetical protein